MQYYSGDYSDITKDLYWTDHLAPVMLVKNSTGWVDGMERMGIGETGDNFIMFLRIL